MLFHDHFYDFRDESGREECEAHEVFWTEWDFALAESIAFIKDHTDSHGHLIWEAQSDRVNLEIVKRIDKHDAAVERRTGGKKYKASPGEYFISHLWVDEGDEWPTYDEWVAAEQAVMGE